MSNGQSSETPTTDNNPYPSSAFGYTARPGHKERVEPTRYRIGLVLLILLVPMALGIFWYLYSLPKSQSAAEPATPPALSAEAPQTESAESTASAVPMPAEPAPPTAALADDAASPTAEAAASDAAATPGASSAADAGSTAPNAAAVSEELAAEGAEAASEAPLDNASAASQSAAAPAGTTASTAAGQTGGPDAEPAASPTESAAAAAMAESDAADPVMPLPPEDERIQWVQQRLTDKGYAPGPVDGMWGPRTARALRAYQQEQGLQTTGEINEASLQALRR